MSRKPSVINSAVFAPLLSIMVLMAMVEPCRNSAASATRAVAFSTACDMPSTRWLGVDGALPSSICPVFSSNAATSVNVPPVSAASRVRDDADERGPLFFPRFGDRDSSRDKEILLLKLPRDASRAPSRNARKLYTLRMMSIYRWCDRPLPLGFQPERVR